MAHTYHRVFLYKDREFDVAVRPREGGFRIAYQVSRLRDGHRLLPIEIDEENVRQFESASVAAEAAFRSMKIAVDSGIA
ncbi:hypothetical protein [Burkholderia diffusa]|uniref:hypothetical protein n=1 Tax=Burkholderia diffusa TaxID=488732 RepID=UPI001583A897|nr:hypothetical protein [Burkholderia diffusa]